jgi:RNA polymerase sigma-70 factor, ECF subfamily
MGMTQPSTPVRSDAPSGAPDEPSAAVIAISDRVLLQRHVEGDRDAFPALMREWSGPIYGYLTRSGVRGVERDDLFQDIFCKVHRSAGTSLPDGALRPWLFAIAVNTVRDHFRRSRVRSVVELRASPEDESSPESADRPDRAAETKETAAWLERQVEELPLPQREAVLLCAVQGLEMNEAAVALGIPADTVKTRLRRARISLAEAAERRARTASRESER